MHIVSAAHCSLLIVIFNSCTECVPLLRRAENGAKRKRQIRFLSSKYIYRISKIMVYYYLQIGISLSRQGMPTTILSVVRRKQQQQQIFSIVKSSNSHQNRSGNGDGSDSRWTTKNYAHQTKHCVYCLFAFDINSNQMWESVRARAITKRIVDRQIYIISIINHSYAHRTCVYVWPQRNADFN